MIATELSNRSPTADKRSLESGGGNSSNSSNKMSERSPTPLPRTGPMASKSIFSPLPPAPCLEASPSSSSSCLRRSISTRTTSSLSSSSSSHSHHRKTVRFADSVLYDAVCPQTSWPFVKEDVCYTVSELRQMRNHAKDLARRMGKGNRILSCPEIVLLSLRGLEDIMSKRAWEQKKTRRGRYVYNVLDEQDRQGALGMEDTERLREVAQRESRDSVAIALELAEIDQEDNVDEEQGDEQRESTAAWADESSSFSMEDGSSSSFSLASLSEVERISASRSASSNCINHHPKRSQTTSSSNQGAEYRFATISPILPSRKPSVRTSRAFKRSSSLPPPNTAPAVCSSVVLRKSSRSRKSQPQRPQRCPCNPEERSTSPNSTTLEQAPVGPMAGKPSVALPPSSSCLVPPATMAIRIGRSTLPSIPMRE